MLNQTCPFRYTKLRKNYEPLCFIYQLKVSSLKIARGNVTYGSVEALLWGKGGCLKNFFPDCFSPPPHQKIYPQS